jgi:two-component system, sensor histidine kinase FlrB
MTSLPMPASALEPGLGASRLIHQGIGPAIALNLDDEQFLLRAFHSFSSAAASLETSYSLLRAEVERLRRELEDTQGKLRREQALAEIAAVLAHEIRNPLGSLELFAGLLAEAELDAEPRQWVEQVQAGLRTLAATVNNVLHFHSLPEPALAPIDLGQLLDWVRDFFAPLARQARITLSLQNCLAGVSLSADRHRLEQVLQNLVLNAVRALPGGGWIEIGGRAMAAEQAVVIIVTDTGPGISPENLPRIFDPGFSTRAGSPGLGLAVCRKIVEQHGGTITASSRRSGGAVFTLKFPLTDGKNHGIKNGVAA